MTGSADPSDRGHPDLGLPDPADLIPHRSPFLLVDRLIELRPGHSAVGEWDITPELWFLAGHFPDRPVVPGVLQIEALAQTAACALGADERFVGRIPLFGGIDRARFRRQVVPGDTLRLEVEMTRLSGRGGRGTGAATVGGSTSAEVEMMFVFG